MRHQCSGSRHRWAELARAAALLLVMLMGGSAAAQTPQGPVNVERLRFSPFGQGLTVQGGQARDEDTIRSQLLFGYEHNPLILLNKERTGVGAVIDDRFLLGLTTAYGVLPNFELGVSLPLYAQFGNVGGPKFIAPTALTALDTFGVGDPGLSGRYQLLDDVENGVDLALGGELTFPISGGNSYFGDEYPTFRPGASVSRPFDFAEGHPGWFGGDLNVLIRNDQPDWLGLPAGDEVYLGLGGGARAFGETDLIAELTLATQASSPFEWYSTPAELLLAGRSQLDYGLSSLLGGGLGLTQGYGTPMFRVFLGLAYESLPCPLGPEDLDGFQDDDKCLDPDDDADGVLDVADRCPLVHRGAKDADGDGCPDTELLASCGEEDEDGFEDDDGCPEPDNDLDGLADASDACPLSAEDLDGDADGDGCPESLIKMGKRRIEIKEKVLYEFDKSVIRPASFELLNQIASLLIAHPEIEQMRVEGHTDSIGSDKYNQKLSQARSASVVRYLTERGVDAKRLVPVGYGESRPIADNKTDEGREKNRRVDFMLSYEEDER